MTTYIIEYRIPHSSASYDLGGITVENGTWTGVIGRFEINFSGTHWEVCDTTYDNLEEFIEGLKIILPYNKSAMTEIIRIVRNATEEARSQDSLDLAKRLFEESIRHAREMGVPEEHILKTKSEIDAYFG